MVLGFCYRPWLVLLAVFLLGCGDGAKITSYTAPEEKPATFATAEAKQGMLGAILPADKTCWFLKATGAPEDMQKVRDTFESFAQSVDVSGDQPRWTLPEGWTEQPGNEFRYRTIRVPVGSKQLDLSVTSLPFEGSLDQYLLANVNRWRGQVGLPDVQLNELSKVLRKVTREGKSPIYLCEFEGTGSSGAMGGAPFASGQGSANSSSSSQADAAAAPDVRTQPPPEWQPGRLNSMRKAAFVVSEGEQTAEITVTFLTAEGGELLPNVQRWRGQVNLPPIDEQELPQHMKSLEVDGEAVPYFVMHGPEDQAKPQSLLVALVPRGELVWFVKMMGDSQLVQREQARFEQFARTLQFQ